MIRTLGKPLLKERTTTQALKPLANHTRSFSRCRRAILNTPSPPVSRNSVFIYLSTARTGNVRYSTVPNEANVKRKAGVPPPSTSNPVKKPKVDLRPAPKKPSQEPRGATPPRPPAPALQEKNAASSDSSFASTTAISSMPITSTGGPIQTTQHDISEATKHGILSPPPEGASRIGRIWHQAKQLFWFYWGGMKMIFVTHRRQVAVIRGRIKEAQARGEESGLTRWESRFLRTYKKDLVKLVPFVLTLIILEEALPLVVLYAPGLLPSTCLLPSQRQRIEAKRREKQAANATSAKTELLRMNVQRQDIASLFKEKGYEALTRDLVRAVSGILSQPTWGPSFLQHRRIERRLAYLAADDAFLVKEDLGSRLKEEELVEALEERGLILQTQSPQHMYGGLQKLQWWLKGARDDKARLGLILQAVSGDPSDLAK